MKYNLFWFRNDLRLEDNCGLYHSLQGNNKVIPIYIFDDKFFKQFNSNDRRFNFLYDILQKLHNELKGSLLVLKGKPLEIFEKLLNSFVIETVFANEDYEPYSQNRDNEIKKFLKSKGIKFILFKDQVIFHKNDILKNNQKPYTVFTPYKNAWLNKINSDVLKSYLSENLLHKVCNTYFNFPSKEELGIVKQSYYLKNLCFENIAEYEKFKDFPYQDKTSHASVYLRFGLISIRKLTKIAIEKNFNYLNELIWREFFKQIIFHYPSVENENFRHKTLIWPNNEKYWESWYKGKTGYPIIDAGINELIQTGYMHNRIRMIVASFLSKNLLIDWRWGEAFFAQYLFDYDLALNNGNWQWASSTGCDAVPYFRIFNPLLQQKKYDKNFAYIKTWIPNFNPNKYFKPIVNFTESKENAMQFYKKSFLQT